MKPFKVKVFGGKSGMGTARVEIDPDLDLEGMEYFRLKERLRKADFKELPHKPYSWERWETVAVWNPDPESGYNRKYVKEEYEKYLNGQETEGFVI